jgi:2-phosphosulfolactate phosphatase
LVNSGKDVILACSAWKNRFNLEDTLFAGAVISNIRENFAINCDSSLMASEMYNLHCRDMHHFIRKTSHWHRLASYGLEKDLDYCITADIANVLPVYKNGALVAERG